MRLAVGLALLLGLTIGVAADSWVAQHARDVQATFLSVNFEAKGDRK